jgi:transcriptional regulator GlxA family with amidase domain
MSWHHHLAAPAAAKVRRSVARGARVLSVCTGAFVLGAAGLLDGRRCTTHWRNAPELALRYPAADVDPSVLYVDDDPVITSAGTAAGIDACLYLVRKEHGSKVANAIARLMVVPPHRDGGQAQYIDRPLPAAPADSLVKVIRWMEGHLDQQVTVTQLAARAHMSPRSFARRFVQETGTTPQRWLTGQRILLAQQLLEETGETVDEVAGRAGFGNATALRHHFRAWRHTTPHAYRRAFRPSGGYAP